MAATVALPRLMKIGPGAINDVATVLQGCGLSRPLIVTGPVVTQMGLTEKLIAALRAASLSFATFTDTAPDPTTDAVEAAAAVLSSGNFDCVIGFGGGSAIDTAKAAAVLAVQGGWMRDYKAPREVTGPALPIVAIPTTAGTGSEATRVTVITDSDTDEKMLCLGPAFLPVAAIVDYELTLGKPFRLTADTGIDSLTHAIEAYVSRRANGFSDTMAVSAMKAISSNIRTACFDPSNRAAREAMMLGSTQAGIAFSNASVALVHGMSRPIGALFHVPHGLSNAMLLPVVTAFSLSAALQRYADCARAMGIATEHDGDEMAGRLLLNELIALNKELRVPTLEGWGIQEQKYFDAIPVMAHHALLSGSPNNNPRIPTKDEIEGLYRRAWLEQIDGLYPGAASRDSAVAAE